MVVTKMDCQWGEWMDNPCNPKCGAYAVKLRNRIKVQEAVGGGAECMGISTSIERCNLPKCPGRLNKNDFISIPIKHFKKTYCVCKNVQ